MAACVWDCGGAECSGILSLTSEQIYEIQIMSVQQMECVNGLGDICGFQNVLDRTESTTTIS